MQRDINTSKSPATQLHTNTDMQIDKCNICHNAVVQLCRYVCRYVCLSVCMYACISYYVARHTIPYNHNAYPWISTQAYFSNIVHCMWINKYIYIHNKNNITWSITIKNYCTIWHYIVLYIYIYIVWIICWPHENCHGGVEVPAPSHSDKRGDFPRALLGSKS